MLRLDPGLYGGLLRRGGLFGPERGDVSSMPRHPPKQGSPVFYRICSCIFETGSLLLSGKSDVVLDDSYFVGLSLYQLLNLI